MQNLFIHSQVSGHKGHHLPNTAVPQAVPVCLCAVIPTCTDTAYNKQTEEQNLSVPADVTALVPVRFWRTQYNWDASCPFGHADDLFTQPVQKPSSCWITDMLPLEIVRKNLGALPNLEQRKRLFCHRDQSDRVVKLLVSSSQPNQANLSLLWLWQDHVSARTLLFRLPHEGIVS